MGKDKNRWKNRYERWLIGIGERLQGRGVEVRTLYDDQHMGDRLVLGARCDGGYIEVLVVRGKKGATVHLFVDGEPALERFNRDLAGLHRQVPRLQNARRRFVHTVEQMGQHLRLTHAARVRGFPVAQLSALQTAVPGAVAMVGVKTGFRQKLESGTSGAEAEGLNRREARRARRFAPCFAARVAPENGDPRAAVFDQGRGGFRLNGDLAALLGLAGVGLAADQLLACGVVPPEEQGMMARLLERLEGPTDVALESVDVASSCVDCGDIGGCSTPDCDACDLPDLGGCDCDLPIPDCSL